MEKIVWHMERRKIAELNPAPYNPRRMTERQAADLGKSLDTLTRYDTRRYVMTHPARGVIAY